MFKNIVFLLFNIIGKLLGGKEVRLDGDKLVIHKKSTLQHIDLSECRVFAELNDNWFSSRLTLTLNDKPQSITFLKKKNSKDFIRLLNEEIAISVSSYILNMVNKWEDYVATQYPRQSRIDEEHSV